MFSNLKAWTFNSVLACCYFVSKLFYFAQQRLNFFKLNPSTQHVYVTHNRFVYIKVLTFICLFVISWSLAFQPVYADHTNDIAGYCDTIDLTNDSGNGPPPLAIMCPFMRIFNVLIWFSGVMFIVMVAWGILKSSAAVGDPKELSAGVAVWTNALYGLFLVLGFFSILSIITNLLGVNLFLNPDVLFNRVADGIDSFITGAGIIP